MFDLICAGERTYYIENPARVGVYLSDEGAWLIDGGYSDTAGELILDILNREKWSLKGIIITHSHPDHNGGCSYLQQRTGCGVYAYGAELPLTSIPEMHPAVAYGGYPCASLRGKGMMAQKCTVNEITGNIPEELRIIPLPGHFLDMIGIRTPDDVVFLADSLCSEMILRRYGITFLYDAAAYMKTLGMIANMSAKLFVPSHVEPLKEVRELALLNEANVTAVADRLVQWCSTPSSFEMLLQKTFSEYHRTMNFEQYCLVGSTVRSYLSWLKDTGRLTASFKDNMMLWSVS